MTQVMELNSMMCEMICPKSPNYIHRMQREKLMKYLDKFKNVHDVI